MKKINFSVFACAMLLTTVTHASEAYCILSKMDSNLKSTDLIVYGSVKNESAQFTSKDSQYTLLIEVTSDKKCSASVLKDNRLLTQLLINEASVGESVTGAKTNIVLNSDGSGLSLICNMKSL